MPGCPGQGVTWVGEGAEFQARGSQASISYAQAQAALLPSGKADHTSPGFPIILLESKTPGSPLLPGAAGASSRDVPTALGRWGVEVEPTAWLIDGELLLPSQGQ